MSDTYTCALCGNTYEKGRSDEEAKAESELLWGKIADEDAAIICDDCFKGGIGEALEDFHKDNGTKIQ